MAVVGSMLTTPADPISMAIACYLSLMCFVSGALFHSKSRLYQAVAICLFVCQFAVWGGFGAWWYYPRYMFVTIIAFAYVAASVYLGYRAAVCLPDHGGRILWSLVVAFAVGAILGPYGCLLTSIPATLMANRRIASRTSS